MTGPRVTLREVLPADLPIHYAHQRDEVAHRMAAVAPRDRPAFDAHWSAILADRSVVVRTIVADGEVAGHVTSFVVDGARQVGYWIARDRWGEGIATAALAALLAEVRERPLFAQAAVHNHGSLRVLERAGFRRVGERRDGDVRFRVLRLDAPGRGGEGPPE